MAATSRLRILESVGEIASRINSVISTKVDRAIIDALPDIERDMQDIIKGVWFNTPTYNSLLYGELSAKLGFYKGSAKNKIDPILEKAAESVQVSYQGMRVFKTGFRARIDIYIFNNDVTDLLNMAEADINVDGELILPWLEWLLTQGDRIIINGFRFFAKRGGRSGGGIMVPTGTFRIPPEHSGVVGNNWLTRTIEALVGEISIAFKKSVESNIKRLIL